MNEYLSQSPALLLVIGLGVMLAYITVEMVLVVMILAHLEAEKIKAVNKAVQETNTLRNRLAEMQTRLARVRGENVNA